MKIIIAYIPVLHEGYRTFFKKHADANILYVVGLDFISEFEHLKKDIRALNPELIVQAVSAWNLFKDVRILHKEDIGNPEFVDLHICIPNDDVTSEIKERYFSKNRVEIDTIFLRWDKKTAVEPIQVSPDITISEDEFDKKMMSVTEEEGVKAKDWWRRLGAIAVKDGKVILKTHNRYVPSDQIAYDQGDPRSNFKSGIHLESSLALHAEAGLVAEAAKEGISLKGADVYAEAFPCPPCAKQLAYAGIRRLYYRTGYKVLDGESILRSQGVEIVFVDVK
ncbi:MAG: deaminase [Patescibacteria group bacterium]